VQRVPFTSMFAERPQNLARFRNLVTETFSKAGAGDHDTDRYEPQYLATKTFTETREDEDNDPARESDLVSSALGFTLWERSLL
jgi:hypothetical protein